MLDSINYRDHVTINRKESPHLSFERVEGKDVPIINSFGSKNYKQIPLSKKIGWKIIQSFGKLANIPIDSKFIGTDQYIVEKYKEVYAAGIGDDAVHKLSQKGYGYRDICRKIGKPILQEINIHTAKKYLPLNNFVDVGYDIVWDLISEDDQTATSFFSNGDAKTRVGTGSGAESDSDTQATFTSAVDAAMESGFPDTTTSKRIDFKGSYGTSAANQAWEEAGVINSKPSTPDLLNRIVASKGTKVSGETWTAEIRITGA